MSNSTSKVIGGNTSPTLIAVANHAINGADDKKGFTDTTALDAGLNMGYDQLISKAVDKATEELVEKYSKDIVSIMTGKEIKAMLLKLGVDEQALKKINGGALYPKLRSELEKRSGSLAKGLADVSNISLAEGLVKDMVKDVAKYFLMKELIEPLLGQGVMRKEMAGYFVDVTFEVIDAVIEGKKIL